MTSGRGLSLVSRPALEQLLASVERGRLTCPFSESDLLAAGVRGHAADVLEMLRGLDASGVVASLRVAIAEREHRPLPRLNLVWTGPETKASTSRSTGLVIERLFDSARDNVIVGGYAFDTPRILEPLHRAMKERGVTVTLFVDIDGKAPTPPDPTAFASAVIRRLLRTIWPFGPPLPEIYYDPRTASRGGRFPEYKWSTLHAKCIVVDDERALLTSANFTDRAQTRNIEAGVLIEDRAFAEELAGHWRQLVSEGLVAKYRK